jgi:hypothetical protein
MGSEAGIRRTKVALRHEIAGKQRISQDARPAAARGGEVEGRGDTAVHAPRPLPEYVEHCFATFFSDPHGVMLEGSCRAPVETDGGV